MEDRSLTIQSPLLKLKSWKWWCLVALNIFFLIIGQAAAVILGRVYYDHGGNSKWMATLVQTVAFPILFVPCLFLSSSEESTTNSSTQLIYLVLIYVGLGVLIAGDNMLYSIGLLYLSASTYSLICATQLAFNAVFSYFINSQKFTMLIFNSVVVLTLSAALLAIDDDSGIALGVSRSKYFLGFITTIGASALYSLLLSLMQLSFQKFLKKETFSVVLYMQIYTSLVATLVSLVGLFASGDWKGIKNEMDSFTSGRTSYVMVLVWISISWQVCSVGVVGLIFVVSSLFSNVISTLSLALTPVAAVVVLHDKMNGVKAIVLLLAFWGFTTYIYQNYIDEQKIRKESTEEDYEACSSNHVN
ncbi:probable purine permease 11 [Impatiens glandulifera]|uniref:probable purine permease 11 n=1 Tax=Impatiens glandulifera TaxID=253017 RepID=UPI001FB057ED|nr:probable purine permease 11 [Impatiens glandulifera]